ncbi:MAG: chorismate-binding protein [Blautia sp.]|nr:chorismate-binding protein [Lachnoclostridium sp.]MCM1211403.1 chorismate-binding protein [Blautia sp.]
MIQPKLQVLQELKKENKFKTAPISMEIFSDIRTPIEVLRILKNVSSHCYLLESVSDHEKWGRYTFLGYDPSLEITCQNGQMKVGALSFETTDPGKYIRQVIEEHKSPRFSYLPPFTGGLVGYFSYDYLKYAEPSLNLNATDTEGFKDVDLMLFDKVIAFDNFRQKIILMVNINLNDIDTEYNRAILELKQLATLIQNGTPAPDDSGKCTTDFSPLFCKEEYCSMVKKAKHHIKEGDIFQIVLSNRMEAGFEGSLLNAYRVLRTLNPSPYMFYFSSSDMEVAGASPETLVKLENGILHTFPLAGTRPRGKTPEEDKALEEELLADPKELAEHNMLVDLGRNDIGKISKFGTVEVEKYHCIERYSHVMHIGSTVRGEIKENEDALSAIDAILPAGTLSGAPKIRACQLINDLENNKRGIYGGAIGYLDFTGNLDTCIAIRIAYKKNNKVFVRSGAGIVAESVPEMEFQECLNKAAAVVNALKAAENMEND